MWCVGGDRASKQENQQASKQAINRASKQADLDE
jgi:hypothetical protein